MNRTKGTIPTGQLAFALPVAAGILWGCAGFFIKTLSNFGMDNYTILESKSALSSLLLFIILFLYDKSLLRIHLKDIWIFILTGGIGMLGINLGFNTAIAETSISLATMLLGLSPAFVIFIARIFFKEKLNLVKIVCLTFTFLGCLLLSGMLEEKGLTWTWFGIIAGLGGAFFNSIYNIISKYAVKRDYNPFTVTFYSLTIQSIIVLPLTDWNCIVDFISISPAGSLLFMGAHSLFTNIMTYVLFAFSMRYVEAGKATLLEAGTEPIVATIVGLFFFSQTPSFLNLVGLAVTIVSLSILCRSEC